MSAEKLGPFRKGRLAEKEWRDLLIDEPTYIVYSYETPIAWMTEAGTYIPNIIYSPTTSRHQALVREAQS